jgi:hypothetical protein
VGWGGRKGQCVTTLSFEASGQRAASLHLAEKLCHFDLLSHRVLQPQDARDFGVSCYRNLYQQEEVLPYTVTERSQTGASIADTHGILRLPRLITYPKKV